MDSQGLMCGVRCSETTNRVKLKRFLKLFKIFKVDTKCLLKSLKNMIGTGQEFSANGNKCNFISGKTGVCKIILNLPQIFSSERLTGKVSNKVR